MTKHSELPDFSTRFSTVSYLLQKSIFIPAFGEGKCLGCVGESLAHVATFENHCESST